MLTVHHGTLGMSNCLVLDGAAGTYLESQNVPLHPRLWSSGALLSPEGHAAIQKMHRAYIDAGANVITSVTYQASIEGLCAAGMGEEEAAHLITRGVGLAREVADNKSLQKKVLVAGGLGAYGAFLSQGEEYTGEYGEAGMYDTLRRFWLPRVSAVLQGNPDVLLFETIPNITEVQVLVNDVAPLARERNIPVWISFSLKIPAEGSGNITLADGTGLNEVISSLRSKNSDSPISVIGANCFDVHAVDRVLDAFESFKLPILLYPNLGEIYDGRTKTWRASHAQGARIPWQPAAWQARGAKVIGGCCRTTPATIKQIHEALTTEREA